MPEIITKGDQFRQESSSPDKPPFILHILNFNAASKRLPYVISANELVFFVLMSGKIEWRINGKEITILPNDIIVLCPNTKIEWQESSIEICCIQELKIFIDDSHDNDLKNPGWSGIALTDFKMIFNLFRYHSPAIIHESKFGHDIFTKLGKELSNEELGYRTRVFALMDELLINTARCIGNNNSRNTDFNEQFNTLDKLLRENLSHQWTVSEMAGIVGFGITAFTEKVKNHCGFSPLNYLINLRISKAIKLIKQSGFSLTEIALKTGFYSSQHFSSTFKKVTGLSPKDFRKKD